jgi:hypothetical protein
MGKLDKKIIIIMIILLLSYHYSEDIFDSMLPISGII